MLFDKIHLEEDEKLLKIVRKHWFYLLSRVITVIGSAILPLIAWFLIEFLSKKSGTTLPISIGYYNLYFLYCYSIWLLFHWMTIAYIFTDHYLDIWAITDRRIISIRQIRLFKRHTGSFRLEKLQDINIEINGIIATLLGYGVIETQTASGSDDEFRERFIPKPRELKALILEAADKRMRNQKDLSLEIN